MEVYEVADTDFDAELLIAGMAEYAEDDIIYCSPDEYEDDEYDTDSVDDTDSDSEDDSEDWNADEDEDEDESFNREAERFTILFQDADLNGDYYINPKKPEPESVTLFPADFPAHDDDSPGERIVVTHQQLDEFIYVNADHLVSLGYSIPDALKIGYLRVFAAGLGLISPEFNPDTFYVTENRCHRLSKSETWRRIFHSQDLGMRDIIRDVLPQSVCHMICRDFNDLVCCVAYMFRVRGHRYQPESLVRYNALWEDCGKDESDLILSWEHIANQALSAMFPYCLDQFWLICADEGLCAPTLIRRINVPPIGLADMAAINRGMIHIRNLLPEIYIHCAARYEAFRALYVRVRATRWGGSINCHLHGEEDVQFPDILTAPLSAVIVGAFDELSPDYLLLYSRRLHKLAELSVKTREAVVEAVRGLIEKQPRPMVRVRIRPRVAEKANTI